MENQNIFNTYSAALPESFFEELINEISPASWIRFFQAEPILKRTVFEGFSSRPHKIPQLLSQPPVLLRLRRLLRKDKAIYRKVLDLWSEEHLPMLAFIEMLDRAFLLENWEIIRDLMGPTNLFACLSVFDCFAERDFQEILDQDFWNRHLEAEAIELLLPALEVLNYFVNDCPRAAEWYQFVSMERHHGGTGKAETGAQRNEHPEVKREKKARHKLQTKLEKLQSEVANLQDRLNRTKKENESLRKQLLEWEYSFQEKLEENLSKERLNWYRRFGSFEHTKIKEAYDSLEALLEWADRAFELQRQADEEYGLITALRHKLVAVDLYLKEIEKIYGNSLVVHAEVAAVKEALEKEKKRLLNLPGVEKILKDEPAIDVSSNLRRYIRLLDASPENLGRIQQINDLVERLYNIGFTADAQALQEELEHKRQQAFERLYAQYQLNSKASPEKRFYKNFEEFIRSGESKKYDLYLDGYNILLRTRGADKTSSNHILSQHRQEFINAVARKSYLFRKVYLVFDGLEGFRDRRGNLEIIYSDKRIGETADSIIIEAIRKRSDKLAILVTEDNEILKASEKNIYAVVKAFHFYTFVFDIDSPLLFDQ